MDFDGRNYFEQVDVFQRRELQCINPDTYYGTFYFEVNSTAF